MDYLCKSFSRNEDGYFGMIFRDRGVGFIKRSLECAWRADAKIGIMRFVDCEPLDEECDDWLAVLLTANQIESLEFEQHTYTLRTLLRVSDALRTNKTLEFLGITDTKTVMFKDEVRKHFVRTLHMNPRSPKDLCVFFFIHPSVSVDSSTPNDLHWLLEQAKAQ